MDGWTLDRKERNVLSGTANIAKIWFTACLLGYIVLVTVFYWLVFVTLFDSWVDGYIICQLDTILSLYFCRLVVPLLLC